MKTATNILAASAALLLLVGFTATAPSSSECTGPINFDKLHACHRRAVAARVSFESNVDQDLTSDQRRFTFNCVAQLELFRCKAAIYCDMCRDVKTFIGALRKEHSERAGLLAVLGNPDCQRYVKPNFDLEKSYCNYLNGTLAFFDTNVTTTTLAEVTTESSPMTLVYSFLICLLVRLVAMMILGCCVCYIRKQRKRQAQLEQNQMEMIVLN